MPHTRIRFRHYPAFVSLLAVILFAAVGVTMVVTTLVLSMDATRSSLSQQQLGQARALAVSCVEHALEQVRVSTTYLGSGNLTLATGTCDFTVQDLGGETRRIVASGTAGSAIRRLTVDLATINPDIIISSWQEIP